MEEIDFNSVDPKVKQVGEDFLIKIAKKCFERNNFEFRRYQMDLAIKQKFLDQSIGNSEYSKYNLSNEDIQDLAHVDPREYSDDEFDEYSNLYLPHILMYYKAFVTGMSNLTFPANGDWLDLKRTTSGIFEGEAYEEFLPSVNDAWVDIIKTENARHGIKKTYKMAMGEGIAYGNSFLGHCYNPNGHYVMPHVPGIGQAGMYPECDQWKKSNICFYYDVNYSELLRRAGLGEFDIDSVMLLEPSDNEDDGYDSYSHGRSDQRMYEQTNVPFGKVRVHEFFIPSFYAKGDDGKPFIAENLHVIAVMQTKKINFNADESLKERAKELDDEQIIILKTAQGLNEHDHGLLFYGFATPQVGSFYQQGPLQPFLPHQYIANQVISETSRMTGYITGSPKSINRTDGGIISPDELDLEDFQSNAVYNGVEFKLAFNPAELGQALQSGLSFLQYIERVLQEGVGVSKDRLGVLHQGRKTAAEVKEVYSGGQMNMVEAATGFDEQILQPSITTRIKRTQEILREQVESKVSELAENAPDIAASMGENAGQAAYDLVLKDNPLFLRLLDYSGLNKLYKEFYAQRRQELLEEKKIMQEVEQIMLEIQGLIEYAQSPIQPMPMSEETLNVPDNQMELLAEQWIQNEQKQRDEALRQAKSKQLDIEGKKLMFKNVEELPLATYHLFYQMLLAPISDSDVVVSGSMTTVSKQQAIENMTALIGILPNLPPDTVKEVDYKSILEIVSRANDTPIRQIMKPRAQLAREEERDRQAAIAEQQMNEQLLQNPGAQPPQQ